MVGIKLLFAQLKDESNDNDHLSVILVTNCIK